MIHSIISTVYRNSLLTLHLCLDTIRTTLTAMKKKTKKKKRRQQTRTPTQTENPWINPVKRPKTSNRSPTGRNFLSVIGRLTSEKGENGKNQYWNWTMMPKDGRYRPMRQESDDILKPTFPSMTLSAFNITSVNSRRLYHRRHCQVTKMTSWNKPFLCLIDRRDSFLLIPLRKTWNEYLINTFKGQASPT